MRSLLWMVLALCVAANTAISVTMERGAPEIVLSVLTGVRALGAVTGLVVLRRTRESR